MAVGLHVSTVAKFGDLLRFGRTSGNSFGSAGFLPINAAICVVLVMWRISSASSGQGGHPTNTVSSVASTL